MHKPFQAVFSDIDGTLLNPQHQLSPRNLAAGRALVAAGVPIVLVSARPPGAMRPLAEALGPKLPLIALNGALILDGDDRVMHETPLAPAELNSLAQLLAGAPPLCLNYYRRQRWYSSAPQSYWCRQEAAITGLEPEPLPAEPGPIQKILLMAPAPLIAAWEQRLRAALPQLSVQRSKEEYLEIASGRVDKAAALRWLCVRRGWAPDSVLALGDNHNDLPLLRAAGYGVALANGPAAVRAQADAVAPGNGEDGWAQALERLFNLPAAD